MKDIIPFSFENHDIQLIDQDGEYWFVANDICRALGISNTPQAIDRLDDDEKNTISINDSIPGNPLRTIINEPGVYRLIFTSRVDAAKRFKRWLAHEVLPSIRKTGGYQLPDGPSDPYPPELPLPGQRFAQERERLGYATRKDLAKATGLKTSVIAQFEELNCQTKRLQFLQILMDAGFDVRYWQSGRRSIWSPVTPQESAVLLTLREKGVTAKSSSPIILQPRPD